MARDTAQTPIIPRPRLLQGAASYPSDLTAPSLSAPFKLDEGYSDETRSQPDKDFLNSPPDDVMPLPDWVNAYSEAERAGEFSPPSLGSVRRKDPLPFGFLARSSSY